MAPLSLPPGFRFHPTDEELVAYYLHRKITGREIELQLIPEIDLYKCEPWDLPEKSYLPAGRDMEWYFYSHRDRKYRNGSRTNRATRGGYWKATGRERAVVGPRKRALGMKKTLVYYLGRAPRGVRTGWVMHEYRLIPDDSAAAAAAPNPTGYAYALCRVFKKPNPMPKLECNDGDSEGSPEKQVDVSDGGDSYCSDAHPSEITQTPAESAGALATDEANTSASTEPHSHGKMDHFAEEVYDYEFPTHPLPLLMEDLSNELSKPFTLDRQNGYRMKAECMGGMNAWEEILSLCASPNQSSF